MKRRIFRYSIFMAILFLLTSSLINPQILKAAEQSNIDFSVIPSASEYVLDSSGKAEGHLNIDILSKEMETESDVVIMYDTSAHMVKDQLIKGQSKKKAGEEILDNIIQFFEHNQFGNDISFIPFDGKVIENKIVHGLTNIKKMSIQYSDKSRNNNLKDSLLDTNHWISTHLKTTTQKKLILITEGKKTVHNHMEGIGTILKKNHISLYPIALSDNNENANHFQNLAAESQGKALFYKKDQDLTRFLQEIMKGKKKDHSNISGKVILDLSDFKGKVEVTPTHNAEIHDQMIHIPFNLSENELQKKWSLPIIFKKEGTYIFDKIKLVLNDGEIMTHPSVTIVVNKGDELGVEIMAKPSQEKVVKPVDQNAEGSIDFHITPKGEEKKIRRKPVDVVFVFDKSGSMDEIGRRPEKLRSAKDAMTAAIQYFKENAGPSDRFAFIPFDQQIDERYKINLSTKDQLSSILFNVNNIKANGGTNYTDPLREARKMLENSSNDKNIVFLTDGKPMTATSKEQVQYNKGVKDCFRLFFNCKRDEVSEEKFVFFDLQFRSKGSLSTKVYFYDGNSIVTDATVNLHDTFYNMKTLSKDKKKVTQLIKQKGLEEAYRLASSQIKLYSVGFGNDQSELDSSYLQTLSSATGAFAKKASEGNVSDVFMNISESINAHKLDTEIRVDLRPFEGKVKVQEGSGIRVENGIAYFNHRFIYEYMKGTPNPIDLTLPLEFTKEGEYTFNDIYYTYTGPNDKQSMPIKVDPITIIVSPEAPPTLKGTMELQGEVNTVDNMIKEKGGKGNYFNVDYTLSPGGLSDHKVVGKLTSIHIIQPLPEGIMVNPAPNIAERVRNGQREAVVTVNKDISYSSGKFTPEQVSAMLSLRAEWALNNIKMPLATIEYTDSRFGKSSHTIPPSQEVLNNKVRLSSFDQTAYDGYSNGILKKVDSKNNQVMAETEYPNPYGFKAKAVKELEWLFDSNHKAIRITYYDDDQAIAYLVPDIEMTGARTGNTIGDYAKVQENVYVSLNQLVAGKGTKYYYQVENNTGNSTWKEFDLNTKILLNVPGKNTIKVKSRGGFSIDEYMVSKTVIIEKLVEEIKVDPSFIELNVNESKTIKITVLPEDALNKDYTAEVKDDKVVEFDPKENVIIGKAPGETKIIFTANDDSKVKAKITIKVTDPFIPLESIRFKEVIYRLKPNHSRKEVMQYLIFNPDKATYQEIQHVTSSNENVIKIVEQDGKWYIQQTGQLGYATVTVTAVKKDRNGKIITDGKEIKDSAVFEVEEQTTSPPSKDRLEGKW
ncbi:hypothetical protein J2S13_003235 [Oikeobacillus pervagus]|uniref:VWFA domain-containing protein n=1 Tax=Oikeobacillus pervagus TaxID=1325931 RepID=A0AAJ1WLY7_9BACI|nr:VWA domain-containing protein [Oikeobacillus pervagus]MDQ0216751.1 hypothetical protein [Oikeobacillus pervagus]